MYILKRLSLILTAPPLAALIGFIAFVAIMWVAIGEDNESVDSMIQDIFDEIA